MLKRDLKPILNGNIFHVRCACHAMNLIVQSSFEYIKVIISKIRNMLVFIYGSSRRRQDFKHFCYGLNVKFTKPQLDAPHRWNSTYTMLKLAYKRRTILMEFYTNICNHNITNEDWEVCYTLLKILKIV